MSYNGYGMENQFGSYADAGPSYLGGAFGAYGADPLLTSATRTSQKAKTKELQQLLIARGYGSFLGEWQDDGDYYTSTAAAVRAFQAANSLPVTGTATQATWDALRGTAPAATTVAPAAPTTPSYRQAGSGGGASAWVSNLFEGLGTGLGIDSFQPSGADQPPVAGATGGSLVPPAESKPVWPWVVAGVTALAVVGGLFYDMGKDDDEDEK